MIRGNIQAEDFRLRGLERILSIECLIEDEEEFVSREISSSEREFCA